MQFRQQQQQRQRKGTEGGKDFELSSQVWAWDLKKAVLGPPPENAQYMLEAHSVANPDNEWCYTLDVRYIPDPSAHFENVYCPRYGLIVATANYKPNDRDAARWSDVVWYFWTQLCNHEGIRPSSLRWIIRNEITNPMAEKLLWHIMEVYHGEGEGGEKEVTLAPRDWYFHPVVRLSNVVGVLHLLGDHADSLGMKSIIQIEIIPICNILIEIG